MFKRPKKAAASMAEQPVPPANPNARDHALMIAAAIERGMSGEMFAQLVEMNEPKLIQTAAQYSLEQCIAWFRETPDAAEILDRTGTFPQFAQDFHNYARNRYPGGLQL